MPINHFQFTVALLSAVVLPVFGDADLTTEPQLPHLVAYQLGDQEFAPGDHITIQELRGTKPTLMIGETYCVTGTYTLSSKEEADLSFFSTTANRTPTPVDPKQTVSVKRGSGSFRLTKTITEDGYLHLTFYPRPGGNGFGGVYFGQGQSVLYDKHFKYRDKASEVKEPSLSNSGVFSHKALTIGPNQMLYDYLGDPVAAPADMDAAYSKEGLSGAMFAAAARAGIAVKALEVDTSEFPFLVALVCGPQGFAKLKEEINKVASYEWSGGVSSENCLAVNIVPYRAFPPQAGQQIYRRLMLREAVLYEKINNRKL